MRKSDVERIVIKYILPSLTNSKLKGYLLYMPPLEPFIRGFYFGGSSYDKWKLVINAFIQPTYIPMDQYWFNMGKRLGTISGGAEKWWRLDKNNEEQVGMEVLAYIMNEGLPFLAERKTHCDVIRKYKSRARHPHILEMETVAYAYILSRKYKKAEAILKELLYSIEEYIDKRPYLQDTKERVLAIQNILRDEPEKADILLTQWSDITLSNLGLNPD